MNIQETVEMSNRYHPYSNSIICPNITASYSRCLHVQFHHQSSRFVIQVCTACLFHCTALPTKFSAGLPILIKHICKRIWLRNLWTEKSFPMKLDDFPQVTHKVLPCYSSTSTTKIKVCNFGSKYAQGCWITWGKQLYNWSDKIAIKRSIQG